MVLVSHDMRLISQVAKEIWICDHKTITMYRGDINNFKMDMRAQLNLEDDSKKGGKAGKGKLRGDASVMKKTEEDRKKGAKKKEKSENGGYKSGALDSILAPKPREAPKGKDAFDVKDVKESLPSAEPAAGAAPERKRYIPPHLRNKK